MDGAYDCAMRSPVPRFTATHAALLQTFLTAPERPRGTLTYPQLAGFLFSIANGPELIPPSEWMPVVFDGQEAKYGSVSEAEQVMQAMLALYNRCAQEPVGAGASLPPQCEIHSPPLENLHPDAPLSQWAQGFAMGHDYLEDIWDQDTPDELDEPLGAVLMVLTFFSSRKLAEAYHRESGVHRSVEQLAQTMATMFPEAMQEYACLGRAIYQARGGAKNSST